MNRVLSKIKNRLLAFKLLYKKSPEAFGEIYDAYVESIYRFIYFKVLRVEVAEDLTSETFLKIWQHIQKEQGDEDQPIVHFQAFLYKVARNVVADFYRKKHVEVELERAESEEMLVNGAHGSWHQAIQSHEEVARLLPHLKDVYREVIILRYIEGYSLAEIASIVGKSPANVRVILHRGLAVLREMTSKEEQVNVVNHYDDAERTYQTPQCVT